MNMINQGSDRLNVLAEKAHNQVASVKELKELSLLLSLWNDTVEFNLLSGHALLPLPINEHQQKSTG